jgi:hypothetical protein
MATDTTHTGPAASLADGDGARRHYDGSYGSDEEHTTETRRSLATSEFWVFIVLSVIVLFFGYESGGDSFSRDDAWRYVTWLGIAYLVSRGLAKAGSYESFIRRHGR